MTLKAKNSEKKMIAWVLSGLVVLLTLSIIGNVYLAWTNRSLIHQREKIIIPMAFDAPFVVSEQRASAPFLQMMALSFLSLRLNVSPETVDMQHTFLMSFVHPSVREDFPPQLSREARRIKENAVTSAFYPTRIKVYQEKRWVDIQGLLKTWIGNGEPVEEEKQYRLQLSYRAGVTHIEKFVEVKDAKEKK